jgi:hypothetical protein
VTARTHVPPSRLRYEAAHPTVAVHCDLETKARLIALRDVAGLSLGELVKQALELLERDVESARRDGFNKGLLEGPRAGREEGRTAGLEEGRTAGLEEGRKAGFAEAVRSYRIAYPCASCGKLMAMKVGSGDAAAARQAVIDARWSHGDCPDPGGS